jgi:hypothetical protein
MRMGNLSFIVHLLREHNSGHMCQFLSFFKTMTIREEWVLVLGHMTDIQQLLNYLFNFIFFV